MDLFVVLLIYAASAVVVGYLAQWHRRRPGWWAALGACVGPAAILFLYLNVAFSAFRKTKNA